MKYLRQLYFLIFVGLLPAIGFTGGTVYLVLGSDTAIWDGMAVNRYHNIYNQSLYTNLSENAYTVMDPAFRAQFTDSFGQPMKMTWWMMAGNIFRYATNTNVPVPNIMTLYLMQKYHGENVIANGDELSLHYHTFFWSDYNQDGNYFWNQSLTFEESRPDFDVTLAQFLLEENVFPVSFRSGWHFMDDGWQHYLNDLLPYSMHNAWPTNRVDTEEPLDNTYNWSESPSEFVPFRPSLENYMVDGDGPGWNVRSASFQHVGNSTLMDDVFAKANEGVDQVACFWAHLPESDFPDNMALMDRLAHEAAAKYPDVKFRYCTAVEAMQLWRGTADTTGPEISIIEKGSSTDRYYTISSNEPLFQPQPFVSVKLKDESYQVLTATQVAENTWDTELIPFPSELAKLGVAATDTAGNLTTAFQSILPDDIYIDNSDLQYTEYAGIWSENWDAAWGTDSRQALVDAGHPIHVRWRPEIVEATYYHTFIQVPETPSEACRLNFVLHSSTGTDTVSLMAPLPANEWIYLGTPLLDVGQTEVLELYSDLPDSVSSASIPVDVVKFSALVRDRDIRISTNLIDYGEISLERTSSRSIEIRNQGLGTLTIQDIQNTNGHIKTDITTPFVLEGMQKIELQLNLSPGNLGILEDTLVIVNNDPMRPELRVLISADTQYPFYVVDDKDAGLYQEQGTWFTSVAQAWDNTSRYAWLNSGASASYTLAPEESGIYDLFEIVPTTVNATNNALYIIKINGLAIDSVYQNQNTGSGTWVHIGRYNLPKDIPIQFEVHDPGNSTVGAVLRADAVKIQMIEPTTGLDDEYAAQIPGEPKLYQNYPNPFNPTTRIRYTLPVEMKVSLRIFDILGHEIMTIQNELKSAGSHEFNWNGLDQVGNQIDTGVYFCRLEANNFNQTIKMLYLK